MLHMVGSPTSAADQLIAHLRSQPGLAGLFPQPDEIPAPGPAQSDQGHLPGHPGVLQVEQPETVSHGSSLETSTRHQDNLR